jgi:alcohol dehydrogenase class IV
MLPGVIALNERDPRSAATYRAIEEQCGIEQKMLSDAIKALVQSLGLAVSLAELGIVDAPIDTLTSLAMEQWTCGHNPVPMTLELCSSLYKSVV